MATEMRALRAFRGASAAPEIAESLRMYSSSTISLEHERNRDICEFGPPPKTLFGGQKSNVRRLRISWKRPSIMPLFDLRMKDFGAQKVIQHCRNQPFVDYESDVLVGENGRRDGQSNLPGTRRRRTWRVGFMNH